MRQRKARGGASFGLHDRLLPGFEIDLRRRGGRQDEASGRDPHADRVARIQRPVGMQIRHMMAGMARASKALEAEHLVAYQMHILSRHGEELAPELVERVAVEPARTRLEPRRVDEVWRADLGHVNAEARIPLHERSGRARVVEVDVREQEVTDLREVDATSAEPALERRQTARRPAVHEGEAVARLHEVRRDHARRVEVEEIDWLMQRQRHPRDRIPSEHAAVDGAPERTTNQSG